MRIDNKLSYVIRKKSFSMKMLWKRLMRLIRFSLQNTNKSNIVKSIYYINNYGIKAYLKIVLWKLNIEEVSVFHQPDIPKLFFPLIKEEKIVANHDTTISVVIPTKNAGSNFEFLLSMLKKQRGLKDLEIIIVDSGSSDETVKIAKMHDVKIIDIPPEKFSHSYSRNLGAEKASGDYIFFTVQDALPPSDLFIYELLSVLKNNNVVAVSCAEFPRENSDLFYRVLSWNHYKFLEVENKDRILSLPNVENHINMRKNAQLSNLACLISKDIFMKYKYDINYAEDLHLGIRLIKNGYKLGFLNSIRIIHSHNRPPYYFLKRGYVDTIFLKTVFPDYLVPNIGDQRLFKDILLTFQNINSTFNEIQNHIITPINIKKFFDILDIRLSNLNCLKYPTSPEYINSSNIDENLKTFLMKIYEKNHFFNRYDSYNNNLFLGFLNHMKLVQEYMKLSYITVDDNLLEDFKSCIIKIFALQTGVYLAYYYLNNSNIIKGIHKELSKGI